MVMQVQKETFFVESLDVPLLDRKEAARLLNIKPSTLAVWDCTKRYELRPLRIGNRVRYQKAVLIAFLNAQQKPG